MPLSHNHPPLQADAEEKVKAVSLKYKTEIEDFQRQCEQLQMATQRALQAKRAAESEVRTTFCFRGI
jgi:hypothetical protein